MVHEFEFTTTSNRCLEMFAMSVAAQGRLLGSAVETIRRVPAPDGLLVVRTAMPYRYIDAIVGSMRNKQWFNGERFAITFSPVVDSENVSA